MILAYMVALAAVIGFARGGRLQNYIKRPLRMVLLPGLAFLIEAFYDKLAPLIGASPQQLLPYATCAQYALLFLFCIANLRRGCMWLVLSGTAVNFLVIALNGFRMPVSVVARQVPALSGIVSRIDAGTLAEYMMADQGARLLFLGDVIYLPFLPGGGLASAGDFLLGIGVFLLVTDIMMGKDWLKFKRRRGRTWLRPASRDHAR